MARRTANSTPRLRLEIHAQTGARYVPALRRQLLKAHLILKSHMKDLSLAIVPAKQMSALHKRFLNESGPTDVLTFELDHDALDQVTAGEIIICVGVAQKQARELGHSVADELLLYALHGLLHLSGLDDRTPADFEVMHAREDEILMRLGVGPIFWRRSS